MTLDYERRGVRLLTESDLDDLVDRVLLQEATIRQVEQEMRQRQLNLCAFYGPNEADWPMWALDLIRWADTLRAILPAEQTGEKK